MLLVDQDQEIYDSMIVNECNEFENKKYIFNNNNVKLNSLIDTHIFFDPTSAVEAVRNYYR